MKNEDKIGFLQEDVNVNSSMRLMSFISLIASITIAFVTLFNPNVKEVGIQLTIFFGVSAFAPKAVQKFAENNSKFLILNS